MQTFCPISMHLEWLFQEERTGMFLNVVVNIGEDNNCWKHTLLCRKGNVKLLLICACCHYKRRWHCGDVCLVLVEKCWIVIGERWNRNAELNLSALSESMYVLGHTVHTCLNILKLWDSSFFIPAHVKVSSCRLRFFLPLSLLACSFRNSISIQVSVKLFCDSVYC